MSLKSCEEKFTEFGNELSPRFRNDDFAGETLDFEATCFFNCLVK